MFLNLAFGILSPPLYPPSPFMHLLSSPQSPRSASFIQGVVFIVLSKVCPGINAKILNYLRACSSLRIFLCLLHFILGNKKNRPCKRIVWQLSPVTLLKFACIDRLRGTPCQPMESLPSLPADQWKGGFSSCPSPLFSAEAKSNIWSIKDCIRDADDVFR